MRRKLGQHFLADQKVIHRIIRTAHVTSQDRVVEIGPGTGVLTTLLARQAKTVIAVEYDAELADQLRQTFAPFPNVQILHADARAISYRELFAGQEIPPRSVKVVANLPYYAAVHILMALFRDLQLFSDFMLLFQKEVADRITASAGSKLYGPLSVIAQYYTRPEYCFTLPPHAFRPRPKVMSSVIRLHCLAHPCVQVENPEHFFQLIQGAFGSRRKTLKNALTLHGAGAFPVPALNAAFTQFQWPETIRGEQLTLADFAALSNLLVHQSPKPEEAS